MLVSTRVMKLFFVIFLLKFVGCIKLNLDDELKFSIDLSTLYSSSIFSGPSQGLIIQKCCPFGKNFPGINANQTCVASNKTSDNAESYETDVQLAFGLKPLQRKLCNREIEIFMGYENDEKLWITRQGYLLYTEQDVPIFLYKKFCVERNANRIVVGVCEPGLLPPESVFTDKIIPICMCISVPLLFATALLYLIVPKLRNVHGETLALYAICLSIGYLLMTYDKFSTRLESRGIQTGIQFFLLSSFCWLLMMTIDIAYHVWSYYPNPKQFQRSILLRLTLYSFIAFGVPALIVTTIHSYDTEIVPTDNPLVAIKVPISIIILLNFLTFIPIYKYYTKNTLRCIIKEEVKFRAKSVIWILTIIAANWMFEMVTMLWTHLHLSLIAFPTLNALQGVVLVCVFVLMPHYKKIIYEWWDERNYSRPEEQIEHDPV